jgi:hypothetical protein
MSDQHTTDTSEEEATTGPRQQADGRTASDAGLTGDEGIQTAQPPPGQDDDEEDG